MTIGPTVSFTLIELLIMVAVIGVLAAVAVPNFVNAHMRALVTRAVVDMKSCAMAIEHYEIDHSKYPFYNNPLDEVSAILGAVVTYLPVNLTTPVSYMAQLPHDPFPAGYLSGSQMAAAAKPYKYIHGYDQVYKNQQFIGAHVQIHFENSLGAKRPVLWQVWSLGPDRIVAHDGIAYDLSNGLMSYGDISRFGP